MLTPWFWLILTVVFALIELVCAFNLVTIWFAISAMIMIFVSGLTDALPPSIRLKLYIGVFLLIAIVLLIFTRPGIVKKLKIGKTKTNVDALIGCGAFVIKKIPINGKGEIKINGQIWTAIAESGDAIEEGKECTVIRIEGVKALVSEKTKG